MSRPHLRLKKQVPSDGQSADIPGYCVSPSTPLLSTSLQENCWACGELARPELGYTETPGGPVHVTKRLGTLSLGHTHAAGITCEYRVYSWGSSNKGQLGHGNAEELSKPRQIKVLDGFDVKGVACGRDYTVVVTETDVISVGSNDFGQLGHGESAPAYSLKPYIIRSLHRVYVTQVACGKHHTMAVTAQSAVYSWGCNTSGQLGHGDLRSRGAPHIVEALWALPVAMLCAGTAHSLALTTNGCLFSWGNNERGQLGLPPDAELAAVQAAVSKRSTSQPRSRTRRVNQDMLSPLLEMGFPRPAAEAALTETRNMSVDVAIEWLLNKEAKEIENKVAEHCTRESKSSNGAGAAAKTDSSAAPSGAGSASASASTNVEPPSAPADANPTNSSAVTAPRRVPLKRVEHIAAGGDHSIAVLRDWEVYAWGAGDAGQLGLGEKSDHPLPARVTALDGLGIKTAACGLRHTLFLGAEGNVLGCGANHFGQLGPVGPTSASPSPPASPQTSPLTRPTSPSPFDVAAVSSEVAETLDTPPQDAKVRESPTNERPPPLAAADIVSRPRPIDLPCSGVVGSPIVHSVLAGGNSSAFLTASPHEIPDIGAMPLRARLHEEVAAAEAAIAECPSVSQVSGMLNAVDMVFSSAAAISAVFGHTDESGLNYVALDDMLQRILHIAAPASRPRSESPKGGSTAAEAPKGHRTSDRAGDKSDQSPAPAPATPAPTPPGSDDAQGSAGSRDRELALVSLRVEQALQKASMELVDDLYRNYRYMGTTERAQILLAALQNPLLKDHTSARLLLPRVCTTIMSAPAAARGLLTRWWGGYPAGLLRSRVLAPLQTFLTKELMVTKKLTGSVMNAIKVLALVHGANEVTRILPPECFYNALISEKMDVLDHYVAWRQAFDTPDKKLGTDGPFSFCSYPFLLDAKAKSKLLHTEARIQMQQTVAASRMEQHYGAFKNEPGASATVVPNQKTRPPHRPIVPPPEPEPEAKPKRRGAAAGLRGLLLSRLFAGSSTHGSSHDEPSTSSSGVEDVEYDSRRRRLSATLAVMRRVSISLPGPESCGVDGEHADMCIIRVRRNHLVDDALGEIGRQRTKNLFKPLRVHFIGEDGIDAGGVKKEFFQLLLAELLCPDYGMLVYQAESRTYWFNTACDNDTMHEDFMLLGLVASLAIYNGVLLDFPLPMALYKKILGQDCTLRDLTEMQPTLGRGLTQLLQFEGPGTVEGVFCASFSVNAADYSGTITAHELLPGGADIPVTEDNRREYVDRYVDFVLNISVREMFEAFREGFMMLFAGPAIRLFNSQELERLVCGNPQLDFDALEDNARYDGGYDKHSQAVRWLWDVVRAFNDEERKLFLKFFTGSCRSPIGGLGNLKCIIQRDGPNTQKLPTSHTCFNTLLLPDYSTRSRLEDCLRVAILNSEGFGLE